MFRNPKGKILRHMFEHPVIHDLADAPSAEKGLIFLLMSASGMPALPDGSYATNGSMKIQFPDLPAAFNALRSRGYLAEPNPPEATIAGTLVPELKELLRAHNLPVSGKRAELIDRLLPALSEDEFSDLAEKHRICYPSALGFEMIYSLYDLWERRELALLEAVKARNLNAINQAMAHMPHSIGYWDNVHIQATVSARSLRMLNGVTDPYVALAYICPYATEFFIHPRLPRTNEEVLASHDALNSNIFEEDLATLRLMNIKRVKWVSCGLSSKCDSLDGIIFQIDNVPHAPLCPGCSCWITAVIELPGENIPVSDLPPKPHLAAMQDAAKSTLPTDVSPSSRSIPKWVYIILLIVVLFAIIHVFL